MTPKEKKEKKKKPSILRWHGVMGDSKTFIRMIALAMLAIACATVAFTQLGFAGIGLPGSYVGYAVILLQPVALGALLLGTLWGTVIGLFAGTVLLAHATVMPLDYYEATYITPLTSVVMFTVIGFMLGFLFALALRGNPSNMRRVIYIVIVCIVVSWLYSLGFFFNVSTMLIVEAVNDIAPNADDAAYVEVSSEIVQTALNMGNLSAQAWIDAFAMAILCCVADRIVAKGKSARGHLGVRAVFGIWLAVGVFAVFMVMSAVSFINITADLHDDAAGDMDSEATYLCNQLRESDTHMDSIDKFLKSLGVNYSDMSAEDLNVLLQSFSIDGLLNGYTVDADGYVYISFAGIVHVSDDDQVARGDSLSDRLDDGVSAAIGKSLLTGKMQRVVFDTAYKANEDIDSITEHVGNVHLAYVYAEEANGYIVTIIKTAEMVYAERSTVMAWTTLSTIVLLLVVFLLSARLLERTVVRRIDETNDVLARVTAGDLDARVEKYETSEFTSLSTGINDTVDVLKGWIAEAASRMDAELATAKAIQESALPRIFPPFPDVWAFDIYATMSAAREVGGDFYDFFPIGDDSTAKKGKFGFLIADVSGKGVPAALFMMNAKALIRGYLENGVDLGEAVENANRQLCDGNDAGMFVTVWAGVLSYPEGHVDFVNAGHNPPLLWQKGEWRWLHEKSGLPLGLFEGLPYETHSVDCQIGDQFLLYTDGVTEAMNAAGELYGEDRLREIATEHFVLHPRALINAVHHDVAKHAAGAEQSDDITMLAMEIGVPPEVTATLIVPASVDELPHVNEFIHTELDRRMCPLRAQHQLDIAVEELFVNVAHYAYPDATPDNPGIARVSYTYSADPPSVRVDIADDGIPYDPLAKPDAVTPDNIMEVPIGGLGILMAKRSVDEMTYERLGGSNIVSIIKKW